MNIFAKASGCFANETSVWKPFAETFAPDLRLWSVGSLPNTTKAISKISQTASKHEAVIASSRRI